MANNDFADFSAPGEKPILDNIFQVSDKFLGQFRLWLEQNPPSIGISNILGFSQFTAQGATPINTSETTSSTTYTDLTTTGPQITGLPDGKYVVFFGATAKNSTAGRSANMGYQVNSDSVSTTEICLVNVTDFVSIVRASLATLSAGGNNTLAAKYSVANGADTGTFHYRWMIAIRYANK